jgi:hypothetical protein
MHRFAMRFQKLAGYTPDFVLTRGSFSAVLSSFPEGGLVLLRIYVLFTNDESQQYQYVYK